MLNLRQNKSYCFKKLTCLFSFPHNWIWTRLKGLFSPLPILSLHLWQSCSEIIIIISSRKNWTSILTRKILTGFRIWDWFSPWNQSRYFKFNPFDWWNQQLIQAYRWIEYWLICLKILKFRFWNPLEPPYLISIHSNFCPGDIQGDEQNHYFFP